MLKPLRKTYHFVYFFLYDTFRRMGDVCLFSRVCVAASVNMSVCVCACLSSEH